MFLLFLGELFRRSCVPGILDTQYNAAGTNPVNLCENCAAGGMDKCQRNTRELYYGDSGAFRCLVESKSEQRQHIRTKAAHKDKGSAWES